MAATPSRRSEAGDSRPHDRGVLDVSAGKLLKSLGDEISQLKRMLVPIVQAAFAHRSPGARRAS